MRHFLPEMLGIVDRLSRRWEHALTQGETPDIARDLKAMSLDVTVAIAMGEHINSLESDVPLQTDIQYLFEALGRSLVSPWSLGPKSNCTASRHNTAFISTIAR